MALSPETPPVRPLKSAAQRLWNETPGVVALLSVAVTAWLLVAIARAGWFQGWWLSLPLLALAILLGGIAWWNTPRIDKAATIVILTVAALLYLPPAEQMALSGDAGIYGNEAAFLARTNSIQGPYTPLAPLSPETRDLFYIDGSEQFDGLYTMQSYDGLVYGGYYVVEPGNEQTAPTIRQSRMAQTSAWQALLLRLIGTPWNFFLGFIAGCISLWLLYATGRRIAPAWVALWSALVVAVSLPQVYLFRSALSEPIGQVWTMAGIYCAVLWLQKQGRQYRWYLPAALFFWITAWSARIDAALLAGPALLLILEAARQRDGNSLKLALAMLPPVALLAMVGNNPPYVGATVEIFSRVQPIFLPGLGALLIATPLLIFTFWRWGHPLTRFYQKQDWLWHLLLFLPAAFVVLWSTIPNPLRVEGVTRSFQEIIWYSSVSLTPLLYWLALAGIGLILRKKPGTAQGFLILTLLGLGAAYFLDYSSAPVYPVSLRRLVADVLPLLALAAGQVLALMPQMNAVVPTSIRTALQGILVAGTLIWLGMQTTPILPCTRHATRSHTLPL